MSFRSVLVHVCPTKTSKSLVRYAARFAEQQQGHLIGLAARESLLVREPALGYLDPAAVQEMVRYEDEAYAEAKANFQEASAALGDRTEWMTLQAAPTDALSEAAARADIIVASTERDGADYRVDLPALLCEAGLPILVAPPNAAAPSFRSVLIAWRNLREARRALSCAMPLLKAAETVCLLQVGNAGELWDGLNAVVARLSAHGVKAMARLEPSGHGGAAEHILAYVERDAHDLVVLGAYGHTRAREWLLGGVTRELVERSGVPLFMSH